MAGQMLVHQVGDVQVHDLAAGPVLQQGLQLRGANFELAPAAADPDEARRGQVRRRAFQFAELVGQDVENAHRRWLDQAARSSRATSSAK